MKIMGLLKREEGKTLEFKRDLSSPKNLMEILLRRYNTPPPEIKPGLSGTKYAL